MAQTFTERPVRETVAQCSPRVHTFYGTQTTAEAIARARSQDDMFFVARKCQACSGWRLVRLS